MVKIKVDISKETDSIIEKVKAKYHLHSRSQAINFMAKEYHEKILPADQTQLLQQLDTILEKSTLTEEDALVIGEKIKKGIAQRHGLYKEDVPTLKNKRNVQTTNRMKFAKKSIMVDRELSALDTFAIEFLKILSKYTSYVVVSGYVVILLGRARMSEDIDVIIPKVAPESLAQLYDDLLSNGFESINATKEELVSLFAEHIPVRFAKQGTMIPNVEVKQARNPFDDLALNEAITVKIPGASIRISPLEQQIAFKEAVLKSPKDLEDAAHLRNVANVHLNEARIRQLKEQLHEFFYRRK